MKDESVNFIVNVNARIYEFGKISFKSFYSWRNIKEINLLKIPLNTCTV